MGQHNRFEGDILAYEALFGTGGAVITLTPTMESAGDKEFDEEDVDPASLSGVCEIASILTDGVLLIV